MAPETLIDRELSLEEGADLLTRMDVSRNSCCRHHIVLASPTSTTRQTLQQHLRGEAMENKDEIIEMALSDKVPFDTIKQL